MDANILVETLLNSKDPILEAAGKDLPKWKKLKHCKKDLENFLQFNIVHLRFRPKKAVTMQDIVCTSNTKFIEVFSALKMSSKKKAIGKAGSSGIFTEDQHSVLTYNLIDCKYNTVDLGKWSIMCFLTITDDNIETLDKCINFLLKRSIEDDLHKNNKKRA